MEWGLEPALLSQGDARTRYQGVPTDRSTTLGDEGITRSSLYKVQKALEIQKKGDDSLVANLTATSLRGRLWLLHSHSDLLAASCSCLREDLASAPDRLA